MSGLFNITDPITLLRLACGLFFIPHLYAKFMVPEALGFFTAASFKPPAFWMYVACAVELVIAIALVFAIYTKYAAWIAALHLVVAGVATLKVTGGKWLWNIGGAEYCFFWAIACAAVAMASP